MKWLLYFWRKASRFCQGTVDGHWIALYRITFTLIGLVYVVKSIPFLEYLWTPNHFYLKSALETSFILWVIVLACLLVGFRTTLMATLNFVFMLIFVKNNPSYTMQELFYQVGSFYLLFMQAGKHFSIDSIINNYRSFLDRKTVADAFVPAWPVMLFVVNIAFVFFTAGYDKAFFSDIWGRGLGVYANMLSSWASDPIFIQMTASKELMFVLNYFVLFFEIIYLFIFWSPMMSRLWTLGFVPFCAYVVFPMQLHYVGEIGLTYTFVLIAWNERHNSFMTLVKKHLPFLSHPFQVFYDEGSLTSRKLAALLKGFDFFWQLTVIPLAENETRQFKLISEKNNTTWTGTDAMKTLAFHLPTLWFSAPLFAIPKFPAAAKRFLSTIFDERSATPVSTSFLPAGNIAFQRLIPATTTAFFCLHLFLLYFINLITIYFPLVPHQYPFLRVYSYNTSRIMALSLFAEPHTHEYYLTRIIATDNHGKEKPWFEMYSDNCRKGKQRFWNPNNIHALFSQYNHTLYIPLATKPEIDLSYFKRYNDRFLMGLEGMIAAKIAGNHSDNSSYIEKVTVYSKFLEQPWDYQGAVNICSINPWSPTFEFKIKNNEIIEERIVERPLPPNIKRDEKNHWVYEPRFWKKDQAISHKMERFHGPNQ